MGQAVCSMGMGVGEDVPTSGMNGKQVRWGDARLVIQRASVC